MRTLETFPMLARYCLVALLLCGMPWAASAHGMHDTNTQASAPALGFNAAFDSHGRLWVVTAVGGHVLLRHSDDFGKTFSAPDEVNPVPEKISNANEVHPRIAIGPQGQIYITWSHPLPQHFAGYVRFARSLDHGQHFSPPITVNRDLAPITHYLATPAVAGNGDVVVAWIDGRAMARAMAKGQHGRGLSVYYSWSADAGRTFVPGRAVEQHSCECCRIALARAPDGNIATLFRGLFPGNVRDHEFAVLPTGDIPVEPQRVTFSDWRVAACPEQGPALAIGADGVRHAVWYESSHGPAIWYGQLDPGHPPRHRLKLGSAGASHADIAVSGKIVWVAWNQVSARGCQLLLRTSHDDGVHFDRARAIATSTAAVYSPQLLVHAGRAYVAWNTADGLRLIATGTPR